ncbi:MAG: 1-acyl-sn-glycerol-3-phosphate acyltransferase [Pseudomonadota bacterium]
MNTRLTTKIKAFVKDFLQGHYDHYLCHISKRSQRLETLTKGILNVFFADIQINQAQATALRKLHNDGIVVYVSKYQSALEYLFYNTRYASENLPQASIAFDQGILIFQSPMHLMRVLIAHIASIVRFKALPNPYKSGFYKHCLAQQKMAGLLTLINPGAFHRRFIGATPDPLLYLIQLQQELDKPVYLVPNLLLFSKTPLKYHTSLIDILFGGEDNPGLLRKLLILLQAPQNVMAETSEPISIKSFLADPLYQGKPLEYLSFSLRHELLNRLNRHRQSITGPVLKPRDELKEVVLRNNRFQNFMAGYARHHKKSIHEVHKDAEAYMDEIASDYNLTIIRSAVMLINWTWKALFDGVVLDTEGLSRAKNAAQKAPLILMPCHRSHLDYILLSHIMFTHNMPCPQVAAGKNLSFWPAGPFFRKCGAFFMRRSFHGAQLYSNIFSEYIRMLLEEGFNIEFFIEGERSRTGKPVIPKTGFLSILLKAFETGACSDMFFVPIYIGYDRVVEEKGYLRELEGQAKKPESLFQLLQARKLLKKRYGHIYVQFDLPISLKELLAGYNQHFSRLTHEERHIFYKNFSFRILHRINSISVVTPQAIVAAAILNYPKQAFLTTDLSFYIDTYLEHLALRKAHISEALKPKRLATQEMLVHYTHRKFIERLDDKKEKDTISSNPSFTIIPDKRPNLEYYKNGCVHFFIPAAYTAISILSNESFQFSFDMVNADFGFLRDLFKYEFIYEPDKTTEQTVEETIAIFVQTSILTPHPSLASTYNITPKGLRKLFALSNFLKTFLEAYWIVINTLQHYERSKATKKILMRKIIARGKIALRHGEITRQEALSRVYYENALAYFTQRGIRGSDNFDGIELYTRMIKKYLESLTFVKW